MCDDINSIFYEPFLDVEKNKFSDNICNINTVYNVNTVYNTDTNDLYNKYNNIYGRFLDIDSFIHKFITSSFNLRDKFVVECKIIERLMYELYSNKFLIFLIGDKDFINKINNKGVHYFTNTKRIYTCFNRDKKFSQFENMFFKKFLNLCKNIYTEFRC